MRILDCYEVYQLENLKNIKPKDQLWFNIVNCLYKVEDNDWTFQLTGISDFKHFTDNGVENILKNYKEQVDDKIQELLNFISSLAELQEYEFYTGYQYDLIEKILNNKLEKRFIDMEYCYYYNGIYFTIEENFHQHIYVLGVEKNG